MKNNSCQAKNKCCTFCLKLNHFPQSLNCKKQRKMKQKKKKEMVIKDGCQTLREFLVSKSFKLSSYNIPYEDLSKILRNKWKRKESQQAKCNKSKIDKEIIGKIVQKIQFLEWNVLYGKLLDAASNGTKFFICAYILYNLHLTKLSIISQVVF